MSEALAIPRQPWLAVKLHNISSLVLMYYNQHVINDSLYFNKLFCQAFLRPCRKQLNVHNLFTCQANLLPNCIFWLGFKRVSLYGLRKFAIMAGF